MKVKGVRVMGMKVKGEGDGCEVKGVRVHEGCEGDG